MVVIAAAATVIGAILLIGAYKLGAQCDHTWVDGGWSDGSWRFARVPDDVGPTSKRTEIYRGMIERCEHCGREQQKLVKLAQVNSDDLHEVVEEEFGYE